MSTTTKTPLFLIGLGFIGGSILQTLLDMDEFDITALVRSEDQAAVLRSLGVTPLLGDFESHDGIVRTVGENEIIIDASTSDSVTCVESVVAGLVQRTASLPRATYIHTSGTGLLTHTPSPDLIYSDKRPEDIDALPRDARHKAVNDVIKRAVDDGRLNRSQVAIIIPPLIYGTGIGPFKKYSMQIPKWIRWSIDDGHVTQSPRCVNPWDIIHIKNLMSAYTLLLSKLRSSPAPLPSLYVFANTTSISWFEIGQAIQASLKERGIVKTEPVVEVVKDYYSITTVSRSHADLLREWGWDDESVTKEKVLESVDETVGQVLAEEKYAYLQ